MTELVKQSLISQFEAALAMMSECLRLCPAEHWEAPVAKYPFWMVAYHTLCFVDLYLEPREDDWKSSPRFHPTGMAELNEEYPSRRFEQAELLDYLAFCVQRTRERIGAETDATLAGDCGVSRLKLARLELHLYNLRHIMHHTGQLSAALRRVSGGTLDPRWVRAGWRE